ncbi:hypothetical protein KIPB_001718, partial [Kipferlia bialata]
TFGNVQYMPSMDDYYIIQAPGMTSAHVHMEGSIYQSTTMEQVTVYTQSWCTEQEVSLSIESEIYSGDFDDHLTLDFQDGFSNCIVIEFNTAATAGNGPDFSGFTCIYTTDTDLDTETYSLSEPEGSFSTQRYVADQYDTWTVCPTGNPSSASVTCTGATDHTDLTALYSASSNPDDTGTVQGAQQRQAVGNVGFTQTIDFDTDVLTWNCFQVTFSTDSTLHRDSGSVTCTYTTTKPSEDLSGTPWWVWVLLGLVVVSALGAVGYLVVYPKYQAKHQRIPLVTGETYQGVV